MRRIQTPPQHAERRSAFAFRTVPGNTKLTCWSAKIGVLAAHGRGDESQQPVLRICAHGNRRRWAWRVPCAKGLAHCRARILGDGVAQGGVKVRAGRPTSAIQ